MVYPVHPVPDAMNIFLTCLGRLLKEFGGELEEQFFHIGGSMSFYQLLGALPSIKFGCLILLAMYSLMHDG
jgi:hypothetical protein